MEPSSSDETNDNQTCLKLSLEPLKSSENVFVNVFKINCFKSNQYSNFDFVMYFIVAIIYLHFVVILALSQ